MSKLGRLNVQVTRERPDYEKDLSKKRLTDAEIREKLPQVWKDRAEVGSRQISVPIPGSSYHD